MISTPFMLTALSSRTRFNYAARNFLAIESLTIVANRYQRKVRRLTVIHLAQF